MKTMKVTYKVACNKNFPWVDWYMHKGKTTKCGVIWTRNASYEYVIIKNNKLYRAISPLEAEYIANN